MKMLRDDDAFSPFQPVILVAAVCEVIARKFYLYVFRAYAMKQIW